MCEPVSATAATTAAASSAAAGTAAASAFQVGGWVGSQLAASSAAAAATSSAAAASGGILASMAPYMSAGSFLMTGLGMYQQGQAAAANAEYQASIHAYNARVAENNAMMAEWAAEAEADTFDDRLRRLMATQDVGAAKSGVVINQDSPLALSAETAREGMLERLTILYRGETEANAYRQAAAGQTSAADRSRANARSAQNASRIGILAEAFKTGKTLMDNA